MKGPGLLVGSAVVDVQDLLVGGEREPVRLVERVRDDREVRGPRIEPVDVVADLRLRPKALEMAIARIREPEVPSLLATTSFGEFSRRPTSAEKTCTPLKADTYTRPEASTLIPSGSRAS